MSGATVSQIRHHAGATVTWLGHATVVLDLDGTRVVTDPVLSRRVAHLWRASPAPAVAGRTDVVAVSHLHWDHLHLPSLARLAPGAAIVVPRGSERLVGRLGYARVVGVDQGDVVPFGDVELEVTHAEHPRSRRARVRAKAVGYVLRGSRSAYFAGDTDLFDGMRELRGLDLALLPVAGWGHKVAAGHLDPPRAVRALELLRPRHAVPIHWGTYTPFGLRRLGGLATPAEDFRDEAGRRVPDVTVHVLPVGSPLTV